MGATYSCPPTFKEDRAWYSSTTYCIAPSDKKAVHFNDRSSLSNCARVVSDNRANAKEWVVYSASSNGWSIYNAGATSAPCAPTKCIGSTNAGQYFDAAGVWTYVDACPAGTTSPMSDGKYVKYPGKSNVAAVGGGVGGGLACVAVLGAFIAKRKMRKAPAREGGAKHLEMKKENGSTV